MQVSILVLELLDLFLVLEELLVLVQLQGVAITSQLVELLHDILGLPARLVEVSPQLLDEIPIPPIVCLGSQRLVLHHELLYLRLVPILAVLQLLLSLVLRALQLRPHNIQLSFRLKVLVLQPLIFLNLLLNFNPMARLQVLLNLHPQNICIDWQLQLLRHLVHLSLLHIEQPPLLRQPALQVDLCILPELDLLSQALLILRQLSLDLVVMAAKVVVELVEVLFLRCRYENKR